MKNILMFGLYNREYARNRILIHGFKENNVEIIHCNVDPKKYTGIKKYFVLIQESKNLKRNLRQKQEKLDAILVAYPGHTVVWLAKILFFNTPIIFDAFLSLYDSNVYDRKVYSRFSIKGIRDYILDWYSVHLANAILLDTYEHINYFRKKFRANPKKCIKVPIGADETLFYKQPDPSLPHQKTIIHFHGNFIPLQGIPYIVEAAEILKNEHVVFSIVGGSGKSLEKLKKKIKEKELEQVVILHGSQPLEKIPDFIKQSDICLGIFGDTEKTQRVIPNKVYECLAMEKPVITGNTPAIHELLTDHKDVLLCSVAQGKDLAEKIKMLCDDLSLRNSIADAGHKLFLEKLTSTKLVQALLADLQSAIKI